MKLLPAPLTNSLKVKKIFAQNSSKKNTKCRVIRTFPFHELEKVMIKWFNIVRKKKLQSVVPWYQKRPLNTRNKWEMILQHLTVGSINLKQVTRDHNIVGDKWAGASNPQPHPTPTPLPHTNTWAGRDTTEHHYLVNETNHAIICLPTE